MSSVTKISTGAPQGCVISPILFILYTNDCVSLSNECLMLKFADDTVLAGLMLDDETHKRNYIVKLVEWCKSNYLHLNSKKTKEIVIDFRTKSHTMLPVYIDNNEIDQVNTYKYLGTYIDSKLAWKENTQAIYKKGQQRLYFLRRLRQFNVDKQIMLLFDNTFIQSVLTSNFLSWYGNLSLQDKNKLNKLVKIAGKVCCVNLDSLDTLYNKRVIKKVKKILKDDHHKLHNDYKFLPSGKRLRSMATRTVRSNKSFVPTSIRLVNSNLNVLQL